MFVGVHSTVLGPAAGGTRMKTYAEPADGLRDVLRLSSAMTSKMAMASVPLGGGKAVLAVPEIPQGQARRELMLRYGDLVESLHGTYVTACDMNTGPPDMDVIAERSSSVFGRTEANGGSGTSAPNTAVGVFHGIRGGGRSRVRLRRPGRADRRGPGRRRRRRSAVAVPRGGRRAAHARRRRRRAGQGAGRGARGRGGPGGPDRRGRLRRVLAVRDRRRPERGHDPVVAVPRDRRRGEQPARRAGRRRASGRTRHPVRARLRRERRRRDPPRGLRDAARERRAGRGTSPRDRRHAGRGVRARRGRGDLDRRGRRRDRGGAPLRGERR